MANIAPKQLRSFFYAIEINLLIWIAVLILVWRSPADLTTQMATTFGFIAGAILQHWAYYDLYKKSKRD